MANSLDDLMTMEVPVNKYSAVCPDCQKRKAEIEVDSFTWLMSGKLSPMYCGGDACRNDPAWLLMD